MLHGEEACLHELCVASDYPLTISERLSTVNRLFRTTWDQPDHQLFIGVSRNLPGTTNTDGDPPTTTSTRSARAGQPGTIGSEEPIWMPGRRNLGMIRRSRWEKGTRMPRGVRGLSMEQLREMAKQGAEEALKRLRAEIIAIERTFPELALLATSESGSADPSSLPDTTSQNDVCGGAKSGLRSGEGVLGRAAEGEG